ncbi:MAG: hypothetical protein IKW93_06290 [Bacteroidales bacterium]|nr:hypothetical protein [Bacteroidales bacterium]
MKYYIPSSNLNLDNILQSECILPLAHYAQRCSGYKTFEQIDELRSFGGIVLFKYPVQFQIKDTGRYNFPILIEFEDDKQTCDFADNEIQEGVFLCTHRLNLTPKNCRIYFFSEGAYNLTLINTKSNKAIKYFEEYKIYPTASMLNLVQMPYLKCGDSNEVSLFEDNYLDKQKGFLYGYVLGNKMSVDRDLAVQLKLTQELYNVLTNLISTPSNISIFENKLEALLDEYKKVDEIEIKNSEEFNSRFDNEMGARFSFLKGSLIKFLKRIDCWDMVCNSLCRRWNCSFLPRVSTLNSERDFIQLRNEIEKRTSKAVATYSKSIPNADLNGLKNVDNLIMFSNALLVNIVAKYIVCNAITPEMLSANRMGLYMDVMRDIVSHLKVKVGEDKWSGSKEQVYVNSLYAFINDPATPFSLNSIDDLELKSIAAFMLKGQSFKDCVTYLRMNEIEDYRYVLSLWGCLCGYMEMSKEALSPILSMENYKMVYKKMFGDDLAEISSAVSIIPSTLNNPVEIDFELFRFILEVFKFKDIETLIERLSKRKVAENTVEDALIEVLNDKPFKSRGAQRKNAHIALKVYLNKNNKTKTIELLSNSGLSKSGQSEILAKLGYEAPKMKKTKIGSSESGDDLFMRDRSLISLEIKRKYPNETNFILSLECFQEVPNKAIERLIDAFGYTSSEKDKKEHLKYFFTVCVNEGRGYKNDNSPVKNNGLYGIYTDELNERAKLEIEKRYNEYRQ